MHLHLLLLLLQELLFQLNQGRLSLQLLAYKWLQ